MLGQYQGKFALALSDVALDQNLAQRLQVPGLPCIRVIYKGQIVDQLDGPADEDQLRTCWINIHSPWTMQLLATAAGARAKDFATAVTMLQAAIEEEPNNQALRVDLADVLARKGDLQDARTVLASIKEDVADRSRPQTRLEFMEEAAAMPELEELAAAVEANSADLELKYQLAVRHVVAERYEESLLVGLEILQADRTFRDDLGRLTMIKCLMC